MERFGVSIGSIGPIDEKMKRKRSNLHISMVFEVQNDTFAEND
jgi:hypothetical protein